ncbi:MAG: bifunctional phosphopantothenoylcysteine decarboxylase/phosphopantothenate--cysteine ligase CoaBC [Janthinobacterium lividum]
MRILVGVCGGIAAYKAAEIVRSLQDKGAQIEVAMTASAERFITPLTFRSLTGKPVYTSLWEPASEDMAAGSIEHIAVAQTIDALLIAPATANMLAKLAHGLADDFLSTVYLATQAPVVVAPAMNVNMWQHPATQANLRMLMQRGVHIVEPGAGYLACGMTGAGRLATVDDIVQQTLNVSAGKQDLAGETVLITAGGTREPIDPVRFLGNRSSGRMGHALAKAALARGAHVILITASSLATPSGITTERVNTAEEMRTALHRHLASASIVIKAAAVADYRPVTYSDAKLRRNGARVLALEPTPDLVAEAVAARRPGTLVIAFAAETEHLEENARAKLLRKGADAIVANDVAQPELGFESERNAGLFLTEEQSVTLPESTKRIMADRILDEVLSLRQNYAHARDPREPYAATMTKLAD